VLGGGFVAIESGWELCYVGTVVGAGVDVGVIVVVGLFIGLRAGGILYHNICLFIGVTVSRGRGRFLSVNPEEEDLG